MLALAILALVLLPLAILALVLLALAILALVLLALAILALVLLPLTVVPLVLLALAVLVLRPALVLLVLLCLSCWPMPNFFSAASSPSLTCCGCCWANCSASFFRLSNSLIVASSPVAAFGGRLSRRRRIADGSKPYPGRKV